MTSESLYPVVQSAQPTAGSSCGRNRHALSLSPSSRYAGDQLTPPQHQVRFKEWETEKEKLKWFVKGKWLCAEKKREIGFKCMFFTLREKTAEIIYISTVPLDLIRSVFRPILVPAPPAPPSLLPPLKCMPSEGALSFNHTLMRTVSTPDSTSLTTKLTNYISFVYYWLHHFN